MYISIIGAAGSGKTILFQALSGIKKDNGIAPNTIVTSTVTIVFVAMPLSFFMPLKA